MKRRNTIIRFRAGYIQNDDTIIMIDGKTGEKTTYENKKALRYNSEMEIQAMCAKK